MGVADVDEVMVTVTTAGASVVDGRGGGVTDTGVVRGAESETAADL